MFEKREITTIINDEYVSAVEANDKKLYQYNFCFKLDNKLDKKMYICPGNVIIDENYNFVRTYEDTNRFLVIDYFVLDKKEKTIKSLINDKYESFTSDLGSIQKIDIKENTDKKVITLYIRENVEYEVKICIDNYNRIIEYTNNHIEIIDDYFLVGNTALEKVMVLNAKEIGKYFLYNNELLNSFIAPNLMSLGKKALACNRNLEYLYLPKLFFVSDGVLASNGKLKKLIAPNLEIVGNYVLMSNNSITILITPRLSAMGKEFLGSNHIIKYFLVSNDLELFPNEFYGLDLKRAIERTKDRFLKGNLTDELEKEYKLCRKILNS